MKYSREKGNSVVPTQGIADTLSNGKEYKAITGDQGGIISINPVFCHCIKQGTQFIGLCGRPHWTTPHYHELARELGLPESILAAYKEKGPAMLTGLSGAFSLSIIDEEKMEVLLAIDRTGIYPLSYSLTENSCLFGSTSDAINVHPQVLAQIDPQSIFNYLYFHIIPGTTNIYLNHHRLKPGEYVHICNGRATSNTYWRIAFNVAHKPSFTELSQDFHQLLRSCIKEAAIKKKTGAFLSGGTDSSTVAGVLNEISESRIPTYSIGFDVDGYDETEYARLASQHFSTEHHEYRVTPDDVVKAIPLIAAAYDQPYGNASAIPTYYCAKLAADDGTECLMGGDGGDELFGGNTRYAKQYTLAHYERLPLTLRTKLIEPLLFNIPGVEKVSLMRKVCSYINQARIPIPMRMEGYNLLNKIGAGNIFTRDFFQYINEHEPENLLQDLYQQGQSSTLINSMLALDMRITLADNDLPKVREMCAQAGIEAVFPLLDDRMITFAAQLPEDFKLRGGQLRYFFKKSLADFLPKEIINKKKHGFGLPFGIWINSHRELKTLSLDSLSDLQKRNIIKQEFISTLTGDYLAQHAAYYGSMIWVLVMLEQWFKSHHPDYVI